MEKLKQHTSAFSRLVLLLSCLFFLESAKASMQYAPLIHKSNWDVVTTPMVCALIQKIPGYGVVKLMEQSGHHYAVQLLPKEILPVSGNVQLKSYPPPWRHDASPIANKLSVAVKWKDILSLGDREGRYLLDHLRQGEMSSISYPVELGRTQEFQVTLNPIGFQKAYRSFSECASQLIQVEYADIRRLLIHFANNSANINSESRHVLDNIVTFLKANDSDYQIKIVGHTDSIGRRRYNDRLSIRRAKAVRTFLLEKGLNEKAISQRGFGERRPLQSNRTASGRAGNRRVEISVALD